RWLFTQTTVSLAIRTGNRRDDRTIATPRTIDDPRVRRGLESQLARWRATLARGATRVGWKTGINAPAVQRALGIDDVVLGHLTSATTPLPGATHSLADSTRVGMEAEVALHIGTDLRGGATPDAARAAVAGLGAAIELVDIDRPFDDLEAIVAGNGFYRGGTFGPPTPPPARPRPPRGAGPLTGGMGGGPGGLGA